MDQVETDARSPSENMQKYGTKQGEQGDKKLDQLDRC